MTKLNAQCLVTKGLHAGGREEKCIDFEENPIWLQLQELEAIETLSMPNAATEYDHLIVDSKSCINTMAEQNVPNHPPTRTDEQIVPRSQWLTIGKSNLLFNAQKIQKNPIFQISVDILSNTNFFQAFTASANVPAIYLQQFWKTMTYNEKTGVYSCQVDEQWFDLSADLLRKALAITPVNPTHPFELPPSGNTVIDFVNELGYPEPVEIVSNIRVNYVYQPWRAILSLINQCLTGKTSGSDKPRHPVLQMLWGIVTQTNVDHAELLWEEFTQGIQTFFSHKASHKASLKNPKKKVTPLLIPYGRKSQFVPKGESVEVFGMAIPDPLITEAIQQSSYYPQVSGNGCLRIQRKTPQESGKRATCNNRATTQKAHNPPTPVKQSNTSSSDKEPSKRRDQLLMIRQLDPLLNLMMNTSEKVIHDSSQCLIQRTKVESEATAPTAPQRMSHASSRHYWSLPPANQHGSDNQSPHHSLKSLHSIALIPAKSGKIETRRITKLDDALLKVLERHTAGLIEKYSALPGPESIQNQESEKSPKEIIRTKKEQGEEKQDSTYSIRSTDKVDLEEFDLKSALFNHMNKKKSANRNTANYHLYHALMEALIADEDAMDKEVADKVKDHKRKHDSDDDEDDDDDEGPSAGSNQGRSTKKRRSDSAASGSAKPPPKDDDQTLTSTGWQITDTRDAGADSSMHRSDPESEHSEQSSDDIPMQDEGNDSDMEDTDNAHIPKVSTTTWFKPIPESERPATPEPEWTIPPNDFPEPENNWANTYATTYQVPTENKLQRKTYDIGSFIKWFCRRTGKKKLCKADLEGPAFNLVKAFHKNNVFLQYQMDECHKLLTNKVDLSNPEGHQILRNIYEPLPLGGPPGDKEQKIALSISKLKATRYLDFGLEELVPSMWVESEQEYDISAVYGITYWWFRRKEFYINKYSEPSDREAVRSQMRILSVISVKISEKDFKNLYPNDFEDLFLLNIQEKLNHLSKTEKTSLYTAVNMWIRNLVIRNLVGDLQLGIESYQTKINLERPNWDAADYYFKEDYTIVPKPRAVVYRDINDQRKLMRLNELHKFSDGTLTRVMEKLDHMVKDFHLFEYNKGMETRKWSEDDKRRSKDFITAIEKRLQIRRIFRSLESFDTLPILLSFTHCGNKSILRVLRIILVILPEHPSETKVFHNEDGNPARANIKQALGPFKDGDGDGDTQFQ
ncbi:hypothetical protein Tco_0003261 [Tanacetum coccineum]